MIGIHTEIELEGAYLVCRPPFNLGLGEGKVNSSLMGIFMEIELEGACLVHEPPVNLGPGEGKVNTSNSPGRLFPSFRWGGKVGACYIYGTSLMTFRTCFFHLMHNVFSDDGYYYLQFILTRNFCFWMEHGYLRKHIDVRKPLFLAHLL